MNTSPEAHTPDSGMATAASGDNFAIISQLMAEKDRLIAEKDELVVSKDRLWRELYQMLREKIERVEVTDGQRTLTRRLERSQLENQQLRGRIQDLEQALRESLDTDEDCDDAMDEDEAFLPDSMSENPPK